MEWCKGRKGNKKVYWSDARETKEAQKSLLEEKKKINIREIRYGD